MKAIVSKKLITLTLGGAMVFWVVTIITSLLPIAAQYRAAYSNWRIQTVWADSLSAGMVIACCVSYASLRLIQWHPSGDTMRISLGLSLLALTAATVLIDVPRSLIGQGAAPHYFLIGLMFNAARFLLLGAAIGFLHTGVSYQ